MSLILQVKRPHMLDHWRAGQHHFWRGPYFRFYIDARQHDQLAGLENGVGSQAVVRYAAPAFLGLGALYTHQRRRTIADHSTFVAPVVLTGHRLWSYSGPGVTGYANPEGEPVDADTRETLMERAREAAISQTLADHVRDLAERIAPQAPDAGWLGELLPEDVGLAPERQAAVAAWGAIAAVVAEAGAEWFVLDFAA